MATASMHFPPDFLWGTATAAHQVEGNNKNNDWWPWERQPGCIINGDRSGIACNWWEDAESDLKAAADMGTRAHRLSLEWSRIEPKPKDFNEEAIERYRQMLTTMHQLDIEPMVTLHHFTNPVWLTDMGDFNNELVIDLFQRFVAKVVASLGDLIPKWITFNEPLVYFVMRYLENTFPKPVERGWLAGFRAVRNMLACHAVAYGIIKKAYPESQVGVAKHYRPIQPWSAANIFDRLWAGRVSRFFNDLLLDSMATGRLSWPIGLGQVQRLAGSFDFIGINYYSRSFVRFPPRPGRLYEERPLLESLMVDDNFFELFPNGLFTSIKAVLRFRKPIYITEHGIPDRDDKLRPTAILTHLREVWRAISFNYPVMGYYHWSLIDNFEWERGWSQRFGLIGMDPVTQERYWRPSAKLYQEICRSNSISSDMTSRYAPDLLELMYPGQPPGTKVA